MDNKIGFTLIELIVVIGVTALILGISLSYYNNFTAQQQLRAEARKIVDVLELAKNKAAAGDSPGTCNGGFEGYRINFTAPNSYSINACCGGTCSSIATYTIQSNVSVTIQSSGCIKFRQLAAGLDTSATGCLPFTPTLKSTAFNSPNCLQITIDNSGKVSLNDQTFTSC